VLGKGSTAPTELSGSELARMRLDQDARDKAVEHLKIAAAIQFTVYGVPSVYYGDEAGVEGYRDPFCRLPYPWGRECADLVDCYRELGRVRAENKDVFAHGEFSVRYCAEGIISYERSSPKGIILVVANVGESEYSIDGEGWKNLIDGKIFDGAVAPQSFVILRKD
jgi:4-alpha-glucanotransferase